MVGLWPYDKDSTGFFLGAYSYRELGHFILCLYAIVVLELLIHFLQKHLGYHKFLWKNKSR